jgi:hypothetical protein
LQVCILASLHVYRKCTTFFFFFFLLIINPPSNKTFLTYKKKLLTPRFSCRFIFCQAVLVLYAPTFNKKEFHPTCMPTLPVSVLPTNTDSQMVVMKIASVFGAVNNFVFSEGVALPENRYGDMDVMSN